MDVVDPYFQFPAGADGTAVSGVAAFGSLGVIVVVGATPDNILPRADGHLVECQGSVLCPVHFGSEVGAIDAEDAGAVAFLCAVVAVGEASRAQAQALALATVL